MLDSPFEKLPAEMQQAYRIRHETFRNDLNLLHELLLILSETYFGRWLGGTHQPVKAFRTFRHDDEWSLTLGADDRAQLVRTTPMFDHRPLTLDGGVDIVFWNSLPSDIVRKLLDGGLPSTLPDLVSRLVELLPKEVSFDAIQDATQHHSPAGVAH